MRIALIAALTAGCASPTARTEVMLEVDAEPAVRATAAQVHVEIRGGAEGSPPESYALRYERTVPASWPSRIALVPLDPAPPRAWSARVEALTVEGDPVAETTVRGGYADMRTVLVPVVLEDACVGVLCGDQRCDSGLCVDPMVDVASAPDLEGE